MPVVSLFGRRPKRQDVPRSKPRREAPVPVNRVDFAELTPELIPYLAQAAYLQLAIFETLTRAVTTAPSTGAKEALSRAAGLSLAKHQALTAEITKKGKVSGETMAPYADRIDRYTRMTAGADWHETLLTSYVTSGLLDDFYRSLADGLPGDTALRVRAIFSDAGGHDLIMNELRTAIEANPRLASRLAMWGRRLVGDTLLIARSALSEQSHPDEARLEPVFTELISAHTRRMDALGLTA
ncbi:ferritin-like fold-containing protein [Glaciihabitans sp. UYNi722]|uniref:ferritin-like fold-containing protein n=1 Tax=Glaciihabitans sp. UYNi722 TaxID=3156344 RepID=UPI0033948495